MTHARRPTRRIATGAAVALGLGLPASQASADTFPVTNTNDDGAGSLRAALAAANDQAGFDVVDLTSVSGTIRLTSGELSVEDEVAIEGPGPAQLSISGNHASRVFRVHKDAMTEVTIAGLTITEGFDSVGAAVQIISALVTLDEVVLTDNRATNAGGAIFTNGQALTIRNSEISNNSVDDGDGGGVFISGLLGPLTLSSSRVTGNASLRGAGLHIAGMYSEVGIDHSTFSSNVADDDGGAIRVHRLREGSSLQLAASTISGNSSATRGGALQIYWNDGAVALRNSTVSGNSAAEAGAIHADFGERYGYYHGMKHKYVGSGSFAIESSTIAANLEGGVWVGHGDLQLRNSIVADNGAADDLLADAGSFSVARSLVEKPGAIAVPGAGNLVGVDPQLQPLANNGGATWTHLPATKSPVIDAGDASLATGVAEDQRGLARVQGSELDLGAVELPLPEDSEGDGGGTAGGGGGGCSWRR
jgi:predicted outer membrane repeat protein